jgi:hypothetical protein
MPLMLKLPRRPGSSNGLDTSAPQPSELLEEPGHPRDTGLPPKAAFSFIQRALRWSRSQSPFLSVNILLTADRNQVRVRPI